MFPLLEIKVTQKYDLKMTIFKDKFSFEPTKQCDLFVLKFLKYFNIISLKRFPKKIKKGFLIGKKKRKVHSFGKESPF